MRLPLWGLSLPWVSARREIRRGFSKVGDRRVTYYLRKDGRFEYVVEKLSPNVASAERWGGDEWRVTYQSEAFDALQAAKQNATESFDWIEQA
jgi:hypothetical protein